MMSWWTCAEWLGSVAFAVDGALTAKRRDIDLVGISAVALAETVGGGTLRDVMLGRTPVGWLTDGRLPAMVLAVAFLVAVVRPSAGLIARCEVEVTAMDRPATATFRVTAGPAGSHEICLRDLPTGRFQVGDRLVICGYATAGDQVPIRPRLLVLGPHNLVLADAT